jgi:hypothetical protein
MRGGCLFCTHKVAGFYIANIIRFGQNASPYSLSFSINVKTFRFWFAPLLDLLQR